MNLEIRNAKITSTSLGTEDHGIFTASLCLDYGGTCQCFGGWALDEYHSKRKERVGTTYGMEFIRLILKTLGVESWEKLPGTVCRVKSTHNKVEAIGHFLEDRWFSPDDLNEVARAEIARGSLL